MSIETYFFTEPIGTGTDKTNPANVKALYMDLMKNAPTIITFSSSIDKVRTYITSLFVKHGIEIPKMTVAGQTETQKEPGTKENDFSEQNAAINEFNSRYKKGNYQPVNIGNSSLSEQDEAIEQYNQKILRNR